MPTRRTLETLFIPVLPALLIERLAAVWVAAARAEQARFDREFSIIVANYE